MQARNSGTSTSSRENHLLDRVSSNRPHFAQDVLGGIQVSIVRQSKTQSSSKEIRPCAQCAQPGGWNQSMSARRVEQIIAYGEAMISCYSRQLSQEERDALHEWESSDAFTRTDDWLGWAKHIGLRPGATSEKPRLVRRSA
jgi:hypothetical protein